MIEVRNLTKHFGSNPVLKDVSFRIEKGESVVIIGRSGCGKSVLLKHLIGLLQPDAGRVLIESEDIVGMGERELMRIRRKFGMLFQSADLFDSICPENVGFAFAVSVPCPAARFPKSREVSNGDLPGIENKKPSELSGGMRKRVGLARAIIYRPAIVLYDEPTTGLDPIVSDSIDQLILRVRDRLSVTTVVVTHDMRSTRRLGQLILMLHNRQIYAAGTADEIFHSSDPIVRRYEGFPIQRALFDMDKSRLEWKVGLFVFVGLVLAAGLLLQFSKGTTFFRPAYEIILEAPTVSGLKPRAQVLMSGIQVGSVSAMQLASDGKSILITLRIYQQYQIYKDARFVFEQSGFLGDQYVAILPTQNQGEVFRPGDRAAAEAPLDIQKIARSAAGLLEHIDAAATNINHVLSDARLTVLSARALTNLQTAFDNFHRVSERSLEVVENAGALRTLIAQPSPPRSAICSASRIRLMRRLATCAPCWLPIHPPSLLPSAIFNLPLIP